MVMKLVCPESCLEKRMNEREWKAFRAFWKAFIKRERERKRLRHINKTVYRVPR